MGEFHSLQYQFSVTKNSLQSETQRQTSLRIVVNDLGLLFALMLMQASTTPAVWRLVRGCTQAGCRLCYLKPAAGLARQKKPSACFRLYQSRFLQLNTRFAPFFEIYKICTPLHRRISKCAAFCFLQPLLQSAGEILFNF